MGLTSRIACCLAVAVCMVAAASAQGKKEKPPQKYYGEAVFRCPPTTLEWTLECQFTDRIHADNENNEARYPYLGWAGAGLFSGNSEMHIGLDSGGVTYYRIWLDFRDQAAPGPCEATSTCRFPLNRGPFEVGVGEIQSNVVDAEGNEIDGGLFAMAVNEEAQTRFRIGFRHPESSVSWTMNFSVAQYAGATNASVKRTDVCTWIFETNAEDHLAGLWSFGQIGGKGKSVRIDEGLFRMPTKVVFRAYNAPGCPPRP